MEGVLILFVRHRDENLDDFRLTETRERGILGDEINFLYPLASSVLENSYYPKIITAMEHDL